MFDKLALFSGNANPGLSESISRYLKIKLSEALITRFSEGEICVKINENVRGKDVFVIQPTGPPSNENIMELLIMIDALKRASAARITAVLPYYGYARQDRKDQPRVPITAKLVADLITVAGASRLLTIDLHAGQIQGFFNIPVDHLYAINVFVEYYDKLRLRNLVVVSPDVGSIKMARAYAKRFHADLAIIDKRRVNSQQTEVMNIMGEVKGKNAIIVDDIVSTAGSLVEATAALKKHGAQDIYAAITHAVLCGPALERIESCPLKCLAVCNTMPVEDSKLHPKIEVLSVASLLGEAIKRIHHEESVSCLFD